MAGKTDQYICNGLMALVWATLFALCVGTPDILDGIIKRVNNTDCSITPEVK
jgi:hypothetical protein